jgi:glucose-6-phosphate isomerase
MSNSPSALKEWAALQTHVEALRDVHMRDLFRDDKNRFHNFHFEMDGLIFDFSRHRATIETIKLLGSLAKACDIEGWRTKMFMGEKINVTEDRAVLHPALRGSCSPSLTIDGENVAEFVNKTLAQMESISKKIRSDKKITDVVNIGIGGSDLGARIVYETLYNFQDGPRVHFLSNVDGARISGILKHLKPDSTIFITTSKTFTTMETMTNAETAKQWAGSAKNFYAVTSNIHAAKKFGVPEDHILPMRDWIGGRVSLWSAAGLPVAIAVGFDNFKKLLSGAKAMDDHFLHAPMVSNIPVMMAMLGVWYRNFWDWNAHVVLPYAHNLRKFPAFIQQLDMESNGKSISRDGEMIDYKTAPALFGETGTNAQHAFMQMLHQGVDILPVDFIIVKEPGHELEDHHKKLNANALAQAQALMQGREKAPAAAYKTFEGNRPSSTLVLDRLDPWHLGLLLALYEHKMFVQGIIWNINSFDQWGVELGKTLANEILGADTAESTDQTTLALMRRLHE